MLPATTDSELVAVDREALIALVLARNPTIAAAREAVRELEARRDRVEILEDPVATATTAPLSWFGSDRIGLGLAVRQPLPFPGVLGNRADRAAAEARAAAHDVDAIRAELAFEASRLFDAHRFATRALAINDEHLELLRTFRDVAAGRYAAGLAPQQAPIQAEVEGVHLEHRRMVLESERERLAARLNALLHRPADAPLELSGAPDGTPSTAPPDSSAERPEIAALEERIVAGTRAVDLARLDGRPSFDVSASYSSMWPMEDHRWMVGVGVRVPFRTKRIRAGIAEVQARVEATRRTLDGARDRFDAEIRIAEVDLEESLHVVELYESRVLPATRDQIVAARAGFETGQTPMLALIEAERSLRNARLELAAARSQAWTARARLDRALGRLPAVAVDGSPPSDPPDPDALPATPPAGSPEVSP